MKDIQEVWKWKKIQNSVALIIEKGKDADQSSQYITDQTHRDYEDTVILLTVLHSWSLMTSSDIDGMAQPILSKYNAVGHMSLCNMASLFDSRVKKA